MDTSYLPLWNKTFIDSSPISSLTATIKAGTIYQTIEFHNTCRYQLLISLQQVGGQPKVVIPAWSTKQFISPGSTFYVSVDPSYPADTNVSSTLLAAEQVYVLLKTGVEAPYVLPLSIQTASIVTGGDINATITGSTDVNVVNIPTITIDSAGNTVNVGNTITANVSGAVTANLPAGSTVEVTQASGAALNIGNVQSIIDNVQSQVVNEYVATNALVFFGQQTISVSNITNGGSVSTNFTQSPELHGFYDGLYFEFSSSGGYTYTVGNCYGWVSFGGNNVINTPNISPNNGYVGYFGEGQAFSRVGFNLLNNTGSTISSDTITVSAWALKGVIDNTTSAPVVNQNTQSTFATGYSANVNTSGAAIDLLSSTVGGYIVTLHGTVANSSGTSGTAYLNYNGSAFWLGTIGTGTETSFAFTWPNGISNQGITFSTSNVQMSCDAITSVMQQGGQQVALSIG